LKELAKHHKIDLNKKYKDLSRKEKDLILYGTKDQIYTVKFTNEY
jgi:excinuclease UvrABC ATPase subunit